MEVIFLDENFTEIHVLDNFKSLIWTQRYWDVGEFDLVCSPNIISMLPTTKYLRLTGTPYPSSVRMRLETISVKSDPEEGDLVILQGRDLTSILDQRIVWDATVIDGSLQDAILGLIDDAIRDPTDTNRLVSNFDYLVSTDPEVVAATAKTQIQGMLVLDAIITLCKGSGLGFRTFWDEVQQEFRFKLLAGTDRSFDQSTYPIVAFTTALENLRNANYVESSYSEKNVCLVAGETGVGNVRTTIEVGEATGLERKEMYLQPGINRNTPSGQMTDSEYLDALEGKGLEELAKRTYLTAFDGEVDTSMYVYGEDFGIGDILQIADGYGHSGKSRVVEMIFSQDANGIKMYPTFETITRQFDLIGNDVVSGVPVIGDPTISQ